MALTFADIPLLINEWDELYDAILEARDLNKCVVVQVPSDKSPSSYRSSVVQAMRGRGMTVNTLCATNVIYVWQRGFVSESTV